MTTGVIASPPILQFTLNNGELAVNGSILTQVGGVNAATYSDLGLTTPLPNPVPLNSRGEISDANGNSKQIFLTPNVVYTWTLFDGPNGTGNQIWQANYVNGIQVIGEALAPLLSVVTDEPILASYVRTAAEIAAGVTPTNYAYAVGPFIDARRYGADPTGVADSTTAIQNAILVATQQGGLIFLAPGIYLISSTLKLRPNVTIWGSGCGDSSTIGVVGRCTIIRLSASFAANSDVIRADPADFGPDLYCRGVSLSNLMIDMGNATNTGIVAIRLKSVSDNPTFENLRIWNIGASHVAVQIGVSGNSGALQTDGTIFSNLVTLTSGIDTYTASMVILEDCNEIAIRDSKILSRSNGAPLSTSIGLQIKATAIGCQGITLDGNSYGGFNTAIESTATGGGVGVRWTRIINGTFETNRFGMIITGIGGLASQFWWVSANRFISQVTNPASITGLTQAASAVVTVNTVSASNPFNVGFPVSFSGVGGMTQINGQSATVTAVGGSSGAWTATVNINSTAYSAFTSGGTAITGANIVLDFASNCTIIADEFSLAAANVAATANSAGNTIWAQLAGITDIGSNNIKFGRNGAEMQFSGLQTTEGTFTLTNTAGITGGPASTARYTQIGNNVTLYVPQIQAAASGTTITFSGIPAAIRPTRQQICAMMVLNNSVDVCGFIRINTDGTALLFANISGTVTGTFSGTGNQGTEACSVSYSLL